MEICCCLGEVVSPQKACLAALFSAASHISSPTKLLSLVCLDEIKVLVHHFSDGALSWYFVPP